jgi:MFS family permease
MIISEKNLMRIDQRYFGSRLAEKLKTRRGRRRAFVFSVLSLLAFGYLAGFATWLVIAPNTVTPAEKFFNALFWVMLVVVTQLQPMLLLSVRSAISWPGQPFDERQQQLITRARSDAFPIVIVLMALSILAGLAMLIATISGKLLFSHPMYGGVPVLIGFSVMLIAMAKHAPYLLLAWQLPDEPREDGEMDDD